MVDFTLCIRMEQSSDRMRDRTGKTTKAECNIQQDYQAVSTSGCLCTYLCFSLNR